MRRGIERSPRVEQMKEREREEDGRSKAEKAEDKFHDSLEAFEGLFEDAPDTFFVYARCKLVPHAV
jgi:hypothetical protein